MRTRREILIGGGAGLCLLATPFASLAQQKGKVWRIGYLLQGARPASLSDTLGSGAFLRGMSELGYVEGRNLAFEGRFADNKPERLPDLAAELVQLKVDVLVTAGMLPALALHTATTTMPIVMIDISDPVGRGLIKSLARPGGNITGLTNISRDLGPKRLELLLELVPRLSRVGVLVNPTNPAHITALESVQAAAQKRRVEILRAEAQTPQEIDKAFSSIRQQNAGALIVLLNPLFQQQRRRIAELAAQHQLPAMTADRLYAEAGCLMSYGPHSADLFRRAATYVDKIFKGARPADLPVEQPTKFELVINGKTAKALGLTIPQSLLVQVDRVIE